MLYINYSSSKSIHCLSAYPSVSHCRQLS